MLNLPTAIRSILPFRPKPPTRLEDIKLTFDTYGEKSSGLSPGKIQSFMEWLTLSLLDCGYYGHTYVIWCANPDPDPVLERQMKAGMRRINPLFSIAVAVGQCRLRRDATGG